MAAIVYSTADRNESFSIPVSITLDPAEIAETLTLLTEAFIGHPACNTATPCAGLRRFAFPLGANDGEELFGEPDP
jgi:hypothetical protein